MAANSKITKKLLTDMARELGIKNAAKSRKNDLIHNIQIAEGHNDCFGRIPDCAVNPCLFRNYCVH